MFSKSSKQIRESIYGFLAVSVVAENGPQKTVTASNGTAFMIKQGYLITAAHSVHQNADRNKPVHQTFELICATDIGQQMETAVFVAEDPLQDIALLKIENPKNKIFVTLEEEIVPRGTSCGFLGFPLSEVKFMPNGQRQFALFERFQGAYISNYSMHKDTNEKKSLYEVDTLMYSGSSGCPAFNVDSIVIGMQIAATVQKQGGSSPERIAISQVVPSTEIIKFLKSQKIL